MNTKIMSEENKIFEINYDLLDPNGNPIIVEITDQYNKDTQQINICILEHNNG